MNMTEGFKKILTYPILAGSYVRGLRSQVKELNGKVQESLRTIDILSGMETCTSDDETGNQYNTKVLAVEAIYAKYMNLATWGCQLAQRIIGHRKALVMPYGVKSQPSDNAIAKNFEAKDEKEFIDRMLDYNNFNEGKEDTLCKYAELEGQMLVEMKWDKEGDGISGLPRIMRRSWYDMQYKVIPTEDDPDEISTIEWDGGAQRLVTGKDKFVFVAFNDVDFIGMPVMAYILMECEGLAKALSGWRKANKYFAKWTPFFKAETWDEAKSIMEWIKAAGWKIGQGAAGRGMEMVGPGTGPADTLYSEIKTNAQIISGATGIPVHYLGFADVLSNRAAATELTEPMEVIALTDMVKWRGFYEQVFDMAIEMRNKELIGKLRTGMIKPKLAPVSDRQFGRLVKFWLEARKSGLVSKELFVEQIPDINAKEELKRLNSQKLENLFGPAAQDEEFYQMLEEMRNK